MTLPTKHLAIVLMLLFISTACAKEMLTPSKNIITRTEILGDFDSVSLDGTMNVVCTAGKEPKIEIKGPDNIVPLVVCSIKGGKLALAYEDGVKFKKNPGVTVYVTAPALNGYTITGVGDISASGLAADDLNITITGVGNVKADGIKADNADLSVTGVGNISIDGSAKSAKMSVSGVGDINAYEFSAANVTASVSGVGNINCRAEETLKGSAPGVGGINYKGSPRVSGNKNKVHNAN